MNWLYPLSMLIIGVLGLVFASYVFVINRKRPVNRVFTLLACSVSLWSISFFIWQISNNFNDALFWARMFMTGLILIPPAFFHFTLILLKLDKRKRKEIIAAYGQSLFFIAANFTPYFISGVDQKMSFEFWPVPGVLFHFHVIISVFLVLYSHILMVKEFQSLSVVMKKQIKYFFIATMISFMGGSTNYFLWYNIPIPPYGNIVASLYIMISGYAILKYRFLDIEIAFKRSIMYTVTYVLVFIIPIVVALYWESNLSAIFGGRWWIGFFILGGVLSYIAEMTYNYYRDLMEERLLAEHRRYHAYLRDASGDMINIKEMDVLQNRILDVLYNGLKISKVGIYLFNTDTKSYECIALKGPDAAVSIDEYFSADHVLVQLLTQTKKALHCRDMISLSNDGADAPGEEKQNHAINKFELLVPLFSKNFLNGFVFLGKKNNNLQYVQDDLNLLSTFANQTALTINTIMAEKALRTSEQKYYDLIKSLPEVIFEIDRNGNFTYINDRAVELLGYSSNELMNLHALDIIIDRERAEEGLGILFQGEGSGSIELDVRKKNGSIISANIYAKSVFHDNEIVGISGIGVDISEIKNARAALQESEEKFRTMIDRSSEMITIVDFSGIVKYQSQSAERIVGYNPDEIVGKNFYDFIHGEDIIRVKDIFSQMNNEGDKNFIVEFRFIRKDGSWLSLESTGTNLVNNRLINGIIVNTRDITRRKEVESMIQRRESRYRSLYNNALVGMISTDLTNHVVITCNDLGYMIFGFDSKDDFIGTVISKMYTDEDVRDRLYAEIKSEGIIFNREVEFQKKDGSCFWAEISLRLDIDREMIETVIIDITKKKEAEKHVYDLSFYDQLTGLVNRDMMLAQIKTEFIKKKKIDGSHLFAVMCMGIDRFTNINTIYGRTIGDKLLKEIAVVLKATFKTNSMISRYEGDKFVILFTGIKTHEDFIKGIVRRASDSISKKPFTVENHILNITSSIGVSIYPDDGDDPEEIVKNSEAAMYMAKDQGENSFSFFDTRMYSNMLSRLQLERELQEAIDNEDFIALYQPKVNRDSAIVGMESLVRWKSKKRGIVKPSEFIPLAEKNGMIIDIGTFMFRKSCQYNRSLQVNGYSPLMIAVNLSPVQFRQPDLIRIIEDGIIQTGLNPNWLELEITESSIMEEEQDNIGKLQEIHDMGISIAIDDFGTGYSSLSKLKDYPIDTLKIDKSFVDNLPLNKKSAAIASSIIDLAHNLGFGVVAEGVESRDQLDFLLDGNCDYFQGNYFSVPLESHEFESRISKSKK